MRAWTIANPHVIAVIENEWSQVRRNKVILITTLAPPFLFVGLALAILYLSTWIDVNTTTLQRVNEALEKNGASTVPLVKAESVRAALLSPFLVLFEMLPIIVPLTVASYSIIGEKQNRSLEALLATPIKTWELLVAKCLAAAIPGIGATWYAFAVFLLAARFAVSPVIYRNLILSPTWLVTITLLTPVFTILAVSLGIIISSKVKDPQSAQQLGSLIVLPMVAIMIGQIVGTVNVNVSVVLNAALAIAVLDVLLLSLAVGLFRREAILTRWR